MWNSAPRLRKGLREAGAFFSTMKCPIHDRMPVLLDPADYAPWLGEEPESGLGVGSLPRLFPAEAMAAYPLNGET